LLILKVKGHDGRRYMWSPTAENGCKEADASVLQPQALNYSNNPNKLGR
jgi:hypothetical protein